MTTLNHSQQHAVAFMPDTGEPAPNVMTPEQAVRYLQLDRDASGKPREMIKAIASLNRMVDKKLIRAAIVGQCRRFWRGELDRYMIDETYKSQPIDEEVQGG
jgi:hypothetical protein